MNILAIFAHPDDHSFFCAGSLARWAEEGHDVYALCVTSGDVGTLRTDLTMEDVAKMRMAELLAANEVLGVKETIVLGYPDGGFIDGAKLRERLVYYVRKTKADRVITLDPWVKYEVHPDHVIVGRMAAEAGAFSAFPLLYPDQLKDGVEAYNCSEIWFMGFLGHVPNAFVDISSSINKKIEAALKFEATLAIISKVFAPDIEPGNLTPEELKKLIKYAERFQRSLATTLGKKVGLKAAEAFYVQNVLPGHFDNFQELIGESLGNPPAPPKIY